MASWKGLCFGVSICVRSGLRIFVIELNVTDKAIKVCELKWLMGGSHKLEVLVIVGGEKSSSAGHGSEDQAWSNRWTNDNISNGQGVDTSGDLSFIVAFYGVR